MPPIYRIRKPGSGVVITARKGGKRSSRPAASAPVQDNFAFYLERLMRLIPADVIGMYLAGVAVIPEGQRLGSVIWAIFCLAGVIALRAWGTADARREQPTDWVHVTVSAVAFIVWVYALGGPFKGFNLYLPWLASLLVLAVTFAVPFFYKGPAE